jgi:transcriptional regulator
MQTPSFARAGGVAELGGEFVDKTADLLPGTLDMLILKAVSLKPLHGYGVLLRIRQISGEALQIPQGSLYPALYRLEHQDLIAAEWGVSDNNRRAKYYTLTAAGRRRLREETAGWNRLASAISSALNATPEEV